MYVHTDAKPCSDHVSLLPCNADVSVGLRLSPFIKSHGRWLHSTGKVQATTDACCFLKQRDDQTTSEGGHVGTQWRGYNG